MNYDMSNKYNDQLTSYSNEINILEKKKLSCFNKSTKAFQTTQNVLVYICFF